MASNALINSNFYKIATADPITGVPVDIGVSGNITAAGNIDATSPGIFNGDGSGLSNVTATGLANGISNVSIPVAGANVFVYSNGVQVVDMYDNEVQVNGNLTANNGNYSGGLSAFDINVTDLYVNGGVANLGAVGQVHITGGNAGEFLQTDGTGNLVWAVVSGDGIANGTSNVTIPVANGPILFAANGVANIAVLNDSGLTLDVPTTTTKSITVDEGLGLGNIIINPVTLNMVVTDGTATSEVSPAGVSVADGTGTSSFVASGQITLLNALGAAALPTLPQQVTTKAYVDQYWTTQNNPTGFDELTKLTGTTISFDNTSRTFTITPTGASFDVWVQGVKYTKTAPESVQIGNSDGDHYIYYNSTGALSNQTGYVDLSVNAPVAIVYWNTGAAAAQLLLDERHGTSMDPVTHEYLHRTRGAAMSFVPSTGFTIVASTTGSGNSDADAEIGLGGGTFYDEDIQIDVINSATPTPNTWEQNLSLPAQIPVLYRSGTAWLLDTATGNFPLKIAPAGTRPAYNSVVGVNWGLTEVASNKFLVMFVCATNNVNHPVISIMGQAEYGTQAQAEAASFSGLQLSGLPTPELRPLYKLVYDTNNGFTNAVQSRITAIDDIRLVSTPQANLSFNGIDLDFREQPATVFGGDATANSNWRDWVNSVIYTNGTSNVRIPVTNGNVNISAGGSANVLVVTSTGANVNGTFAVTGTTNLNSVGNVTITGGSNGQVLTTDGTGVLSWTTSLNKKYSKEWHVDPVGGNDTTGDGSYGKPWLTIAKALTVVGNTGEALFLHHGVYSENVTYNLLNVDIIGDARGGAYCTGTWTINSTSTTSSTRVRGLHFTNALNITSTAGFYLDSVTSSAVITKSGGGYLGINDVIADTGTLNITGAGFVNVTNARLGPVVVNNAGATVTLKDCPYILNVTVTSGVTLLDNGYVFATGATANSVTSAAGSFTYMRNMSLSTSTGTAGRVSLLGFWSADDVTFDRANSTLTGVNLGTVARFDALDVFGTSNLGAVGNITITGGSNGQVLTTNGSGVLSWGNAGNATAIVNGNSNVVVSANGNVTTSVGGVANVVVVTSTGANVSGTLNVSGVSTLGAVGNVKISGGTAGAVLTTDGVSNLSWSNTVAATALQEFTATAAGTNQTFTLSNTALTTTSSSVYVNGVLLRTGQYSISGTTLTVVATLSVGDLVSVGAIPGAVISSTVTGLAAPSVASFTIGGGTPGAVLSTNGSGVMSWTNTVSATATQEFVTTAAGAGQTFTLSNTNLTNTNSSVYVNGVLIRAGASNQYTISGTTLTVSRVLAIGDVITVGAIPGAVVAASNVALTYGSFIPPAGSINITVSNATNATPATAATIMQFTLPSAGTWEVMYQVRGSFGAGIGSVGIFTGATGGTVVDGSQTYAGFPGGGPCATTFVSRVFITTTGSALYSVRGWNTGASNWTAWVNSTTDGASTVTWVKIA